MTSRKNIEIILRYLFDKLDIDANAKPVPIRNWQKYFANKKAFWSLQNTSNEFVSN